MTGGIYYSGPELLLLLALIYMIDHMMSHVAINLFGTISILER